MTIFFLSLHKTKKQKKESLVMFIEYLKCIQALFEG